MLSIGRRVWLVVAGASFSWLGAAVYVVVNDGFGAGDLAAFAFWCVLFAAFLTASSYPVARLIPATGRAARSALGAFLGILSGVAFTLIAYLGLGPWILAFSFPAALLWVTGGGLAGAGIGAASTPIAGRSVGRTLAHLSLVVVGFAALPVLLVLGDLYVWGRAVHTRYVLPPDFIGPVVLVYDVAGAPPLRRDDDGYLVQVPASGIVLTSTESNDGWRDPDVFYGREDSITQVTTDWPGQNDTLRGVRAYWLSTRVGGTLNGVPEPYMDYEAFAVTDTMRDRDVTAQNDALVDSLWALYAR